MRSLIASINSDFFGADAIRSRSKSAFVHGVFHVTDRLNLTGGLRQAWDSKDYTQTRFPATDFTPAPGTTSTTVQSDASFHALDWRGTIDYHITDDVMAYATVSKAYKAGAFSYTIASWTATNKATGAAQSAGIVPIPNEEVINYEAGLRMSLFDNRLRLNPTVFRMDFTNRQAAVQVACNTGVLVGTMPGSAQCPVGFLILVQNQGDVRLEGFEFDGQAVLAPWFIVDGGVAVTKPKLKNAPAGTVNLFPDVPSPTFNVGATLLADLPFGNLTANANYAFVGEQETHPTSGTDSSYTLPSYGLANVRLQLALNDIPVTITAFANNVLDKTYATYGQRFGGGFWDAGGPANLLGVPPVNNTTAPPRNGLSQVRGRPREVGLSLQYDF